MRRNAFTLTEMLVSIALVLFIMSILGQIFQVGQSGMESLRAIGDLEARLRTATTMLRGELAAPHFGDNARLSDPGFSKPTQGFVLIRQGSTGTVEGADGYGLQSVRAVDHVLHFSVRLRGNRPENFFSAGLPSGSSAPASSANMPTANWTSFDPTLSQLDARYEDPNSPMFNSQWAEVGYFLLPAKLATGAQKQAGTTNLYNLYRAQYVVVPDNTQLGSITGSYPDMSCKPSGYSSTNPMLNSPADLVNSANRNFNPASPPSNAANPLLNDVISFQVQIIRPGDTDFVDVPGGTFDAAPGGTASSGTTTSLVDSRQLWTNNQWQNWGVTIIGGKGSGNVMTITSNTSTTLTFAAQTFTPDNTTVYQMIPPYTVKAVRITLRIWDTKSQQARQVSIIQDM